MKLGVAAITFNEELLIKPWLNHLLESKLINVISIVDCGSTDRTVDIIREFASRDERIILQEVVWNRDFSILRNKSIAMLKKEKVDWFFHIDVDTFLNCNPDLFVECIKFHLGYTMDNYSCIYFPSRRFFNLNVVMHSENPTWEHWSLINLKRLKMFTSPIHEGPIFNDWNAMVYHLNDKNKFLGHYDIAKLVRLSRVENKSLEYVMGRKKKRYLDVRKLHGLLAKSDPDSDKMTEEDMVKFGKIKLDQELDCPMFEFPSCQHSWHLHGVL